MTSDKDLDGLEKNLNKMKLAKRRLELNERMQIARIRMKDAKFFSLGKDNYFHNKLNIWTETARAEPYYFVHWVLYYRVAPLLVTVILLVGFLLL